MSAAGKSLRRSIVIPQNLPAICEQRQKWCVDFGTDHSLKSRSKPYIDAKVCEKYISTVFLPHLNE
jgi:hypothetical protein